MGEILIHLLKNELVVCVPENKLFTIYLFQILYTILEILIIILRTLDGQLNNI